MIGCNGLRASVSQIVVNKMFMDPNCGNGRCEDPQVLTAL